MRLAEPAAREVAPMMGNANRVDSFRHAVEGWWYVLRTQRNAWIHAVATVLVVAVAAWLDVTLVGWGLLILAIGMVWTAEFINTAVEAVVDLISPGYHPLAKISKDVMAAAVLLAAGSAVLIGLLVLGPPLLARLGIAFGG